MPEVHQRFLHLLCNLRPGLRVGETLADLFASIGESPTRKRDTQVRTGAVIRVLIHDDVYSLPPELLYQRQRHIAHTPQPAVVDLEVRQFHWHARLTTDRYGLCDRLQHVFALVTHVA